MQTSYCCRRGGVCGGGFALRQLSGLDQSRPWGNINLQPLPTNRPQEVGQEEWRTINAWAAQHGYVGWPKRSFQAILVRQARFKVLDWSSISFQDEGDSTRPAPWAAPLWGASLLGPRCLRACGVLAAREMGRLLAGTCTRTPDLWPALLAPTPAAALADGCDSDDEGGCTEDVRMATPWEIVRKIPDTGAVGGAVAALRCKYTGRLVVAASLVRMSLVPAKGTASPAGPPWRASVRGPLRCDVRTSSALATHTPPSPSILYPQHGSTCPASRGWRASRCC